MSEWDPQSARYQPADLCHGRAPAARRAGIEEAVFLGTSLGGLVTMIVATMRSAADRGRACSTTSGRSSTSSASTGSSPTSASRSSSATGTTSPPQLRERQRRRSPGVWRRRWLRLREAGLPRDGTGRRVRLRHGHRRAVPGGKHRRSARRLAVSIKRAGGTAGAGPAGRVQRPAARSRVAERMATRNPGRRGRDGAGRRPRSRP